MASARVLVVEDEEDIADLIRYNLEAEGFRVACEGTGEGGLEAVRHDRPDIVLLDLMLPGLDGLGVCRALRADDDTVSIPIIMVSARGEESDIVKGLELGADDYVTKPFSPKILTARVRSVLRRRQNREPGENDVVSMHGIDVHPGRHEVRVDGETVSLTNTEFRILHFLARRPGWVFTRYQIVDGVRGENYPVTERSVDVQIVGLRKKLAARGEVIETVRGVGYRMRD